MKPLIPIDKFEIFADGLDHPEGLVFDREGNLWVGGVLEGQVSHPVLEHNSYPFPLLS